MGNPIKKSGELLDKERVIIYDAPEGTDLSNVYKIVVQGLDVPVYKVKVAPENDADRRAAIEDRINTHLYFDEAGFAYFDMDSPVDVTVQIPETVTHVRILPTSAGLKARRIEGQFFTFELDKPQNIVVEVNGKWVQSLHIFANPVETDMPDPEDPNVIYYGPGIHEVTSMAIGDNKTLYIAGGAIVKAIIGPDEAYTELKNGLRRYDPTFLVRGNNITVRGRGIIDASECTNSARNIFYNIVANNYKMEGIILQDSSTWNMPIYYSENVSIDNIKILGYRSGTNGMDICNSIGVRVTNSFVRTLDDLIVVKTLEHPTYNICRDITVENCVLWNQAAHALSVGAELVKDVDTVLFSNCDIVHNQGREWSLRIFHTDNAIVSNVIFENIRIEESVDFISLWIDEASWSTYPERGYIKDVTFKDISVAKLPQKKIELLGYDGEHKIENVFFENVMLGQRKIISSDIVKNEFVTNVVIE